MPPEEPFTPEDVRLVGSEKFCFIDGSRPCTAECMAFQTPVPDGRDYESQQWAHCMVLTSAHKMAKHLVVLATSKQNATADAARGARPPLDPSLRR